jgi:hypothetical protein
MCLLNSTILEMETIPFITRGNVCAAQVHATKSAKDGGDYPAVMSRAAVTRKKNAADGSPARALVYEVWCVPFKQKTRRSAGKSAL